MNIYKLISFVCSLGLAFGSFELSGELAVEVHMLGESMTRFRYSTVPAPLECVYQYPERRQLNAILSHMMNQLTKLFVRAQDVVEASSSRRVTRFRVVNKFDSSFFEKAFSEMVNEYRQLYNSSLLVRERAGDPCQQQEQIKLMWQQVLDRSQQLLQRASFHCLLEFNRTSNRADDSRGRLLLQRLATRELAKIRSNLLDKLCDDFQMCYNDLL